MAKKKSKRERAEAAAAKKEKQRAQKRDIRKARAKDKAKQWRKEIDKFSDQLKPFGLKIRDVPGDGNCLFRSVADQIVGEQKMHVEYRSKCCKWMKDYPDDFRPFVFDEDWDDYLNRMRKDGEWGGNLEIIALSHALGVHITIHQFEQPRWEVKCPNQKARTIHLSYHDGQHYNSVRNLSDDPRKEATEIKAFKVKRTKEEDKTLKILRESTGCRNTAFIEEALRDNDGNLDATIEYLIAMKETGLKEFFLGDGEIEEKKAKPEVEKKKLTPKKKEKKSMRLQKLSNKQRKEMAKQKKLEKRKEDRKNRGKKNKTRGEPEPSHESDEEPVDLGSLRI
mmetsp:Transcript_7691/g.11646  ORF Transcript_7691/g.11646 Transcript_7691/m.11646 type:complete len:337 (+) Transcript_7691:112-1122(+)